MGAACSYRPQKNAHLEGLETEAACRVTDGQIPCGLSKHKKDRKIMICPVTAEFVRTGSRIFHICLLTNEKEYRFIIRIRSAAVMGPIFVHKTSRRLIY